MAWGFNMGRKILVVAIALFIGAAGFCASVSFQIVQHDESLNEVCVSTLIMEDEILNSFYSFGHIVSNVPAVMSSSKNQDSAFWSQGYKEASDGFFDNFIQVHLYLNSAASSNQGKASLGIIKRVAWKVASVATGKTLDEGSKSVSVQTQRDTEENVRGFADELASYLQKTIKK